MIYLQEKNNGWNEEAHSSKEEENIPGNSWPGWHSVWDNVKKHKVQVAVHPEWATTLGWWYAAIQIM